MGVRELLAASLGGVLLLELGRIFRVPAKRIGRILVQAALGLVALWAWDTVMASHRWIIGINPVTGLVTGLLGPAGFMLLVSIKVLLL